MRHHRRFLRLLPFIAAILVVIPGLTALNPKAEYFFMQAQEALMDQRTDDALQHLRHAAALDTADPFIHGTLGMLEIAMDMPVGEDSVPNYDRVKRMFLADPGDYFNAELVAGLARHMRNFDDLVTIYTLQDSLHPKLTDPAMSLAEVYLIKYILGDSAAYRRTIETYDRLQRGIGPNIGLSSNKIRAYSVRKDTAAVIDELRFLLHSAPADPQVALFVGTTFDQFGMPDSAMTYYDAACRLDSTYGPAYMIRAEHYLSVNDTVNYVSQLRHALESSNIEPEAKLELFNNYISEEWATEDEIDSTYHVFQEANPTEALLYSLYGAFQYYIKNYDRAAELLTYAVSLNPDQERDHRVLVGAYAMTHRTEDMIRTATEAASRFPGLAIYPATAADGMFFNGDTVSAIEYLKAIDLPTLASDNERSDIVAKLGDYYYAIGDTTNAETMYERAISFNPDNAMVLNNLAYLWASCNERLEAALVYSVRSLRSNPNSSTSLDTYAWILFRMGNYSEARKSIIEALNALTTSDKDSSDENNFLESIVESPLLPLDWTEDDPAPLRGFDPPEDSAVLLEHAGDIFYWCRQPNVALALWKMAAEQDPDNALLGKKIKNEAYYEK